MTLSVISGVFQWSNGYEASWDRVESCAMYSIKRASAASAGAPCLQTARSTAAEYGRVGYRPQIRC